jgi:hypothetical protein
MIQRVLASKGIVAYVLACATGITLISAGKLFRQGCLI